MFSNDGVQSSGALMLSSSTNLCGHNPHVSNNKGLCDLSASCWCLEVIAVFEYGYLPWEQAIVGNGVYLQT